MSNSTTANSDTANKDLTARDFNGSTLKMSSSNNAGRTPAGGRGEVNDRSHAATMYPSTASRRDPASATTSSGPARVNTWNDSTSGPSPYAPRDGPEVSNTPTAREDVISGNEHASTHESSSPSMYKRIKNSVSRLFHNTSRGSTESSDTSTARANIMPRIQQAPLNEPSREPRARTWGGTISGEGESRRAPREDHAKSNTEMSIWKAERS